MFCPKCSHPNLADADACVECQQDTSYFRERVFIGQQFVFVRADDQYPIALQVDDVVQVYQSPAILSRHRHAIGFGDEPADAGEREWDQLPPPRRRASRASSRRESGAWPLPDQPKLAHPSLELLAVVTDRKIYQPDREATLFIVAPDAGGSQAALEIQFAGQKVYEAQVPLNQDGLALHYYSDLREGEYTAMVSLPDQAGPPARREAIAACTFSVAEYTLSPLIAILDDHQYAERRLKFTLKLLRLSLPYSGPVEFGLQCGVCGERVVATQQAHAAEGISRGDFDISRHGGPFHVQVTTPDGNTALVAFPGTGAVEREHISINPLGQTAEMGLLPWENAQPVRGFYIGSGEINMTPLMLESVRAARGRLQAASDLSLVQLVTFDPRSGSSDVVEQAGLGRGQALEFDVDMPYSLVTVGAFTRDRPFEGWGVVIKPVAFEARLGAPQSAQPGEEIEVYVHIDPTEASDPGLAAQGEVETVPAPAFCWLLAYDARLEHESPVPKLAKRIYESVRDASGGLSAGQVPNAQEQSWEPYVAATLMLEEGPTMFRAMPVMAQALPARLAEEPKGVLAVDDRALVETPVMVVAPSRMEFPELVHNELFYLEGQASRTVKLGDQIGTWRVRAYLFRGPDYRELTADVQADKPLYAELDLPAIASPGDDISASVNYHTREPADLLIATPFGETRAQVSGSGTQRFSIRGPGRVEARLESPAGLDWTVRDIAPPGVQQVTASRLLILDRGQTAQGEKVVVYASLGPVLKDTITALIGYPFG